MSTGIAKLAKSHARAETKMRCRKTGNADQNIYRQTGFFVTSGIK
jgi:hypothetical protein